MPTVDISVIIPVYNRVDELERTLQSIQAQSLDKSRFEVVVADDGSAQDLRNAMNKYPDLQFTYCRQEDLGFRVAAVRNLGIANAQGEILVFSDNGILFSPDTLEKHVALHQGQENLVLLGTMHATSASSDPDAMRGILDANSPADAIDIMKRTGGMGDGREGYLKRFGTDLSKWYIPWLGLWGGHFSVRASFLKAHGISFDENFTSWGGEDNDFGIQLCRAGAHYLLSGEVEVVHYPTPGRANNDIGSDRFRIMYEKVKQYIADKHRTEDVLLWQKLGSKANDPVERDAAIGAMGKGPT